MAYKYTPEQKTQALILLAANRGDLSLTASQTGINVQSITKWANMEMTKPSPDIGKGMEIAIQHLLGQLPSLVNKYNIAELLGTLLEKWLQYKGVPQNSTQTILTVLATKSESQLDAMIQDIDQGRQLFLKESQVVELESDLEAAGLRGLAQIGVPEELAGKRITRDTPTDVIDLIEYQIEAEQSPDDD